MDLICAKAKRIAGLIYRKFYCHLSPESLYRLYLALIRPHTEYACQVWNPHLLKDIASLESVQKFALRMCAKQWDSEYTDLLSLFNLSNLEARRNFLSLCLMYKIVHGKVCFPPSAFSPVTNSRPNLRSASSLHYNQPFTRTNYFQHSFVPSSCALWNSLPADVSNSDSYSSFKLGIKLLV